jgi:hypothetical protein
MGSNDQPHQKQQPQAQPSTLMTRSHIFNTWDWVAQLYPQALHGLQWDYYLLPVTTRGA